MKITNARTILGPELTAVQLNTVTGGATAVNAQSKLIKIEETGASLPEAQRVPATGSFS
jgi:hypothetical protein